MKFEYDIKIYWGEICMVINCAKDLKDAMQFLEKEMPLLKDGQYIEIKRSK